MWWVGRGELETMLFFATLPQVVGREAGEWVGGVADEW